MIRAKFLCRKKSQMQISAYSEEQQRYITGMGYEVELDVVYAGSEENDRYFCQTPFGKLTLGLLNEAAADQIVPGKFYYMDITEA
jgi:hypothetical protein